MATTVYLIRHGESTGNAQHVYQGIVIDESLTEKGIFQATKIKKALTKGQIDAVYSSPLKRCMQTARIIFGENFKIDDRFRERGVGEWSGKTRVFVQKTWPEQYLLYKKNRDLSSVSGGEPFEDFEHRIRGVLQGILQNHAEQGVAMVTHGGFIKALLCFVRQLPREAIDSLDIPNANLIVVSFSETTLESGHVPDAGGNKNNVLEYRS